MKRRWKSVFLSFHWLYISVGTSLIIILTQPTISPAQEPSASTTEIINTSHENTLNPVLIEVTPPQDTFESIYEANNNKPTLTKDSKKPEETTKPEASTEKKPTDDGDKKKPDLEAEEPAPTPEEIARQQKLMEADKLYSAGNIAEAEKIYREAKEPFQQTGSKDEQRQPAIVEAAQLPPAGKVYWREAEAGILGNLQTRTLIPLELLVQQVPQFVPGHIRYAESLKKYGDEKKALQVLERGATLYPNEPELVKARVTALGDAKKWMEASLAARQFAILNPQNPLAPEFTKLADNNLKRYKSHIRGEIRGNAIANIITGALGYAVTGSAKAFKSASGITKNSYLNSFLPPILANFWPISLT